MSTLAQLVALFRHGEWADRRLLDAVRAVDAPLAVRELAHIRGAQEIWLSRIEERAPAFAVWPEVNVDELAELGGTMEQAFGALFDRLTDEELGRPIEYRSRAGDPYTSSVSDILLHVLMHGQYHRGKANAALGAVQGTPASVDFILWQWSGASAE